MTMMSPPPASMNLALYNIISKSSGDVRGRKLLIYKSDSSACTDDDVSIRNGFPKALQNCFPVSRWTHFDALKIVEEMQS